MSWLQQRLLRRWLRRSHFFFSSRRRHTRCSRDWSSDVCSSDLPTYRDHPGHAEAVEIVFDPERIPYRDILELFFQIHDPTTKDRQGNDFGSDYRSEIFYTSEEQRRVAEETIADVDASGLWPGKVVTAVSEAVPFWVAEAEHQDYLQRYPSGYNCHFPRPGWKLPHRDAAAPVTTPPSPTRRTTWQS